ncbi:MAG: DUF2079 domain-containing protein [Chloroflexi bacterium]|nr:DUF2079 domain-containing protein [Chloroflexota bacterium]
MALIFTAVFFWLNQRQYLTFQVRSPDADRFVQAIWNTGQGNLLYSTIKEGSILKNHFTPYMALLAPFLRLFSDPRILFLIQIVGFTIAGLLLYKIVYDKYPQVAPWFLLAFFLNHDLHQVALYELRRITLALPYLALIAYSLHFKNRRLLLTGIFFALLCKEEVGLIVFGVGLFILLVERDWKWGIPIAIFGLSWLIVMQQWIIPAFGTGNYPPIKYFATWGNSLPEMFKNILTQPVRVIQMMFDERSLIPLWHTLLAVAVILPFLGAEYLLICLPLLGVMLLATDADMHSLDRWYMAAILPFLFAAVGTGLTQLPKRWANMMVVGLLLTTAVTYWLYSPGPLAKNYEPYRYQLTDRHQQAWQLLEHLPDEAAVSAQVAFTTQVAQREILFLYPWNELEEVAIEYILLGEGMNAYPIPAHDLHWEIVNLLANPTTTIAAEANGIYLIQPNGQPEPAYLVQHSIEESILLEKVEIAVSDSGGFFQNQTAESILVNPSQKVRISLYWRALATLQTERTVSVRISDSAGNIIVQNDSSPAEATRPTSWWQEGWYFREIRYLEIPSDAQPDTFSVDILLYDSYTDEQLLFDNNEIIYQVVELQLEK